MTPISAKEYYCDPENGSMSNDGSSGSPWASLKEIFDANKTFSPGDVIYLLSGHHGSVTLKGTNSDYVTIQAKDGESPTLKSLSCSSNAKYWIVKGLEISPETAPGGYEKVSQLVSLSNYITIEDCNAYSVKDISSWSKNDWIDKASSAIGTGGEYNVIRNCSFVNVRMGIALGRTAQHNVVEGCLVDNFSVDASRIIGSYNTFINNTLQNCYKVDSNHDDGIQSYSVDENYNVGVKTVYGNIVKGNTIINTTDPNRNFIGALQGIGLFDGMFEDWVIENNVVITSTYHGIALFGAINCKIANNTVIDTNIDAPKTWVSVVAHKNGTPSEGNIVINNLATSIYNDSDIGTVENNIIVSPEEYNKYFVDYDNFDLHLKPGCSAINSGTDQDAPDVDKDGNTRPYGGGYDVGAYEYSGAIVNVTGISLSETSISLDPEGAVDLIATITPGDATNQAITWVSSEPNIASVDKNGRVVGLWGGAATITATTLDGNFSAECQVTVNPSQNGYNVALTKPVTVSAEPQADNPAINLVNGNLENDSRWSAEGFPQWAEVDLGAEYAISRIELYTFQERSYQYTISAKGEFGEYEEILDHSKNKDAGPMIDDVEATARFIKIEVTGIVNSNSGWVSLNELKVYGNVDSNPVTGITISETSLDLSLNEYSTLSAEVIPASASNTEVAWSSDNRDIATVNNAGLIKAVGVGTCTITATSASGGFTAECVINVTNASTSIQNEELNADIKLYPNPCKGDNLNIEIFTNKVGAGSLRIMNIIGKQVVNRHIEFKPGENSFNLNINTLPTGIYILSIYKGQLLRESIQFNIQ